jgi:ABC-2 type transport system permease protein
MVSFLTGFILNGAGDVTVDFIKNTLEVMAIQILFLVAITIISSLLLFITKSNVISVISTLVFPLIISVLHLIKPDIRLFEMLDFTAGLNLARTLDFEQLKYIMIGAVLSIILGNILITQVFRHQEL